MEATDRNARMHADLVDQPRFVSLSGSHKSSRFDRQRLNMRAFIGFMRSGDAFRWLAWLMIWELGALNLIWRLDVQGYAAVGLLAAALLWAWPWLACARRRHLALLSQPQRPVN